MNNVPMNPSTPTAAQERQSRRRARRHTQQQSIYWFVGFTGLIGLALVSQIVAALQNVTNFNSDEAIMALMSRHILQGQIPTYFYGQQYLGSLESILAAGFMWLFGSNLITFRVSAIVLFGLFVALHGILVHRFWGMRVALLSLLILALPAPLIRMWTFRPMIGLNIILVLGTGTLVLAFASRWPSELSYLRTALIGFLIGLGAWSNPMISVYIATAGYVWALQTPEWRHVRETLARRISRIPQLKGCSFVPIGLISVFGLGVLAFFSGACQPRATFATAAEIARILLAAAALGITGFTLSLSSRRRRLIGHAAALSGSVALGNLPQWRAWLLFGVAPDSAVRPSCLASVGPRLSMLGTDLLPHVWGVRSFARMSGMPIWSIALWSVALLAPLTAFVYFLWNERRALWSLLTAKALPPAQQPAAVVSMLFGLPVLLVILGNNVIDESGVRYLLVAWQASTIIFAIFLNQLLARLRFVGFLVLGFWIGFVGVNNVVDIRTGVSPFRAAYSSETVAALTTFLREHQIQGGYADYWVAYPLDFLTQEQFIFAPYNHLDRYQPYSARAARFPVQAYVFNLGTIPATVNDASGLRSELKRRSDLFAFSDVVQALRGDVVLERQRVGDLDVWLVKNSSRTYAGPGRRMNSSSDR